MTTRVVRVKQKGQITLPADLRRKYHMEEGAKVVIEERDGKLELIASGNVVDPTAGIFKDHAYMRNPDVNEEKAWIRHYIADTADDHEK